ncbi:MAG: hypothetical protein LBI04_00570 [Treponema sp.]|jgi:hypothetical protein|nr:hypothetical protein [Treponema sp.]
MKNKSLGIFLFIFCGIKLFSQCYKIDELANRRNNFIDKGFGFDYQNDEIINYELFLLRHNNQIKISEYNLGTELNDREIEIEYDSIIVTFQTCDYRTVMGTDYQTILKKIESKDNIKYLYNIRHGLTIYELERIIGKIELGEEFNIDEDIYNYIVFTNGKNNVGILFSEDKIIEIIWFIKWRTIYDE